MDLSELVEKIYKSYFYLFLSIGKKNYGLDDDTLKDMIQETFIKVWKNKHTIRIKNEAGVRSFAIRAFRNTCISYLRIPNPFVEKEDNNDMNPDRRKSDFIEEKVADTGSDPLSEILLIEEMRLQETVINKLPPKYRETVKLSLEGIKRKDIAQKLGLKNTVIHNLKHRGLKKYEKILNMLDPLRKS